MSLSTRVAGTWRNISSLHVNVGGTWKPVSNAWTKVAGVWKSIYTNLAATLNAGSYSNFAYIITPGGSDTTVSVICGLVLIGEAPFTYQWYNTGSPSSVSSSTAATYTIRLIDNAPITASGTVWCVVTDAYGNTTTTEVAPWDLELAIL